MDKEDKRIEESQVIQEKIKMDECICLTGTIHMFRMLAYKADDIFYVAWCLNGQKPKGKYFRKIGAARFHYEMLKTKII